MQQIIVNNCFAGKLSKIAEAGADAIKIGTEDTEGKYNGFKYADWPIASRWKNCYGMLFKNPDDNDPCLNNHFISEIQSVIHIYNFLTNCT